VVLEAGAGAGGAWRSRYRSLRLNGGRSFAGLPGMPIPRSAGTFPSRDDVVGYLEAYRDRYGIEVRPRTRVLRIEESGGRWDVDTTSGAWSTGEVVVATGLLAEPVVPEALAADGSSVRVLHSAEYVDATPFVGADVLVVGAGCSGMEIASDLARGGAARVLLSVRTPPNMLPRSVAGLPGDPVVHLLRRLPAGLADPPVRLLRRLTLGDLTREGLPIPLEGPFARLRRPGDAGPAIVDRVVADDLRAGRIGVVAAVDRLLPDGVRLVDGARIPVDVVVAATGFRAGLEQLVGHLGVLDDRGLPTAHDEQAARPGLRFLNFGMRPGLLAAAGVRGRRTAAAVARDYRERDDDETAVRRFASARL
jgi:putative flavoprotein involved in K+ transport